MAISMRFAGPRRDVRFIEEMELAEARMLAEGPIVIAELTHLLEAAVHREFQRHNRTGDTLKTLKPHNSGLHGEVEIAGGAPYVEFGTKDHDAATPGGTMHWIAEKGPYPGEWFAKHVRGTEADDFADRAIQDIHAEEILGAAFGRAILSVFERD